MLCVPMAKLVVLRVACPLDNVPVPIELLPSLKVTVPVGEAVQVTAAVKVMDWPDVMDDAEAVNAVEVEASCEVSGAKVNRVAE